MKFLVTGSSGYLGSHLLEHLRLEGHDVIGIDLSPSETTTHVGSIVDPNFVDSCCHGVDAIFHTASLHKPHISTHTNQDFVDTNVTGTLNLLEASIKHGIRKFIFTSTTSVFGKALVPSTDHEPTTWITESVIPVPKNVYGITKLCAENLCQLYHDLHRDHFSCIILRTSRFFPEDDDNPNHLANLSISDENMKYNEYLHRRVHLHDVITAHLHAYIAVENIGFGIYIISSTSPFSLTDTNNLRKYSPEIVEKYYPEYREIYERKGWKMNPLDRVYVNEKARSELGWIPEYDFKRMISELSIEENDENEADRSKGLFATPVAEHTSATHQQSGMEFQFLLDETIWSAAEAGNLTLLKILLMNENNNVNSQDDQGYSPLHAAVTYGHISIVEYLLSVGANPNIQDLDGDTPLHTCHIPAIAELLLSKGAIPTILNHLGKSMIEQAIDLDNDEMIEFWKNRNEK